MFFSEKKGKGLFMQLVPCLVLPYWGKHNGFLESGKFQTRQASHPNISLLGLSELFVIEVPFTEQPVLMTYIISNTHPHLCILKLPENFRVNQSWLTQWEGSDRKRGSDGAKDNSFAKLMLHLTWSPLNSTTSEAGHHPYSLRKFRQIPEPTIIYSL